MVKGGSNLLVKLFGLFKLAFTLRGAISITAILIIFGIFGSLQTAYVTSDWTVVGQELGKDILNKDNKLYLDSLEFEGLQSVHSDISGWTRFWSSLGAIGSLFATLWYLYTFARLFYYFSTIAITNNDSAVGTNLFVTSFLMVIFVTFGMITNIGLNDDEKVLLDDAPKYPFRGVVKFFNIIPLMLDSAGGLVGVNNTVNNSSVLGTMDNVSIPLNPVVIEVESEDLDFLFDLSGGSD